MVMYRTDDKPTNTVNSRYVHAAGGTKRYALNEVMQVTGAGENEFISS